MPDHKTQADLIEAINRDYAVWESHLMRAGKDRMEIQGVVGEWTIKDVIAHITWSENEMVMVLKTRVLAGSELWNIPLDERNQVIYEQNRSRPVDEVINEARQVHADLMVEIEKLTDADLNTDTSIRDMIPGVTLWEMLEGNTFKHYREHSEHLAGWLNINL